MNATLPEAVLKKARKIIRSPPKDGLAKKARQSQLKGNKSISKRILVVNIPKKQSMERYKKRTEFLS